MQKKIIVLAISAALSVPGLACAEVSVYGQANLSVDMINDGNSPGGSSNNLVSNGSRLGLKGSEDLGNGVSAVWQMEGDVGMDNGTMGSGGSQIFSRDTFLGLSSASMGTVLAGQHDTPYKMATRRLDMFGDTTADTRHVWPGTGGTPMMGNGHDIGASNIIAYMSPPMSGFSVAAASVFGSENATSASKKGSDLSLAGMFEQGPIYATLAYDKIKFGNVGQLAGAVTPAAGVFSPDDESKAIKLGGSYTMDAFAANAVIEKTTDTIAFDGGDTTGTNFYLAGKFNISSTDAVKAAYTKRGETTTAGTKNADDAKQFAIGYDYDMSKMTSAYALYTKVTAQGALSDPSTLSVGIKHSF